MVLEWTWQMATRLLQLLGRYFLFALGLAALLIGVALVLGFVSTWLGLPILLFGFILTLRAVL